MRSINQTLAQQLPAQLPPAAAMLYGYVDTVELGYRTLTAGATGYTIGAGLWRGDELADELTAAGLPTTHAGGLFTVTPASAGTLTATDRLGVLLGLAQQAGSVMPSAASFTGARLSPVAIPLAGYYTTQHRLDADDDRVNDRLERDMGYTWGGARVLTVTATMHKWALDAWLFGWVQRGQVTFVGSLADGVDSATPGGSVTGRVMQTSNPSWLGEAQLWAEVTMTLALPEPT